MSTTEPKGTALITGASSGIGAIYADRLARRGYDLILVARNREPPAGAGQRGSRTRPAARSRSIAADLSDKADLARVEARAARPTRSITLLVNNAGVGATAPLLAVRRRQDGRDDRAQRDGADAADLCRGARLRRARRRHDHQYLLDRRDRAGSCSTASMAAARPIVLAFSQSLQHELADKGVRVQAVLPGATATEFWDIAGLPVEQPAAAEIVMSAEDMVDAALAGLDQGEIVTIPALPEQSDWDAYEAARRAMSGRLSSTKPAARYNVA